ncbi:MAG: dipeptidase, partial [Candidatus Marinimicrobia bacterium]|nr:dipeptidase [Candidatus Neomarinimicrobiota bacterium]
MTEAHAHAHDNAKRYLEELLELLRIPSISTDMTHQEDMRHAAQWVADNLERSGLDTAQVLETEGHPVVFAEWSGAPAGAPTVLIYGHYDVQPADMIDGWSRDPFTPAVIGDRIVARGATDNKGQVVAHMKAAESLLATGGCPVNLKYLIEGEEECGSAHLGAFVAAHHELLAADICLISDTSMESIDQPSLTYGMRGLAALDIVVDGPRQDLHSGAFGGCLHNPAQALAEIVATLHDVDGRVAVPGFYDDVAAVSPQEREMLAKAPTSQAAWTEVMGKLPDWGEPGYSRNERIGIRPTLEINGISGGYAGDGFKTVIGKHAVAKVSCRLVPDQDPERVFELVRDRVLAVAPPTVRCQVTLRDGGLPALTDREHPAMKAAIRAYGYHWPKRDVLLVRAGGTIPVVATFQQQLGLPVVLMGFALPDCGAHGPDEDMPVVMFESAIDTIIQFMH